MSDEAAPAPAPDNGAARARRERLGLRLRVLLFFALIAVGIVAALVAGGGLALARLPVEQAALAAPVLVQAAILSGFVALGVVVGVWYLFDANVARAIERLSGAIRARALSDIDADFAREAQGARYLGDLAPAAIAATRALASTRNALAESVQRETTRLAAEKSRLETLLADVPVAVLLCSADHQLAFYNWQAADILGAGEGPGLRRDLLDYLREGPIVHAYQRLAAAGDGDSASDLICATVDGGKVLAGRMRVLRRRMADQDPGYVLTLRDVTAELAAQEGRDSLLAEVFEHVRRPAANLQTVIDVLAEYETTGDVPPAIGAAMLNEVQGLTRAITDLGKRYDQLQGAWRPLAQIRSEDLLDSLSARFGAEGLALSCEGPELILRADGFQMVALVAGLGDLVAREGLARAFSLRLSEEDGPGALLRLEWDGAALPVSRLERWLDQPLGAQTGDLTGRMILRIHATEVWPEALAPARPAAPGRHALTLPVPNARRAGRRPAPIRRDVVYDFDLLSKSRSAEVETTRLEDLTFVVFDTETTGLSPERDELVQLAAVRVVNGRRVMAEVLDTLINPGRPIPPGSTDVHGITDSMVVGAPTPVEAGARFHRFARGAVLVAHNAPFDLAFLRRHEEAMGLRFEHPVLDTVLLSAVVFGQLEEHSLDALTQRLGITIPEEARHTALGDTVATAEAFLRLVPMLRARGLETFGDILAEVRRHGRLLKDANPQ